jgi:CheY-like chemotaxis protein
VSPALLIDDNLTQLRIREAVLREAGLSVSCVRTAEQALSFVRSTATGPGVIVTNHVLPGASDSAFARQLGETCPRVALTVISGTGRPGAARTPFSPRLPEPLAATQADSKPSSNVSNLDAGHNNSRVARAPCPSGTCPPCLAHETNNRDHPAKTFSLRAVYFDFGPFLAAPEHLESPRFGQVRLHLAGCSDDAFLKKYARVPPCLNSVVLRCRKSEVLRFY